MAQYDAAVHHDDHGHKQSFLDRWFFSTNHKDIGTLYLLFSFMMFIIGAAMSVVIRAELMEPGLQFVKPEFFNQMTTVHALVMIFGGVMPAFVGLANWMVPQAPSTLPKTSHSKGRGNGTWLDLPHTIIRMITVMAHTPMTTITITRTSRASSIAGSFRRTTRTSVRFT